MNKDGVIVKELIGIKHLLDHQPKEIYHLVKYNDLVKNPKKIINDIYEFLEIPKFKHSFINLDQFKVNGMEYNDTIVGQGLHTIKTNIIFKEKYNAYDIIPSTIINKYKQCNFWEENVNK